jgi:ligand-binding sensor domain-containing protein
MWIGSFAGGSYKLVPVLKNFYSDHLEYPGVESPVVTCLLKDNNGFIWLGTQSGLIRQNKKDGEIKIFMDDKKDYSMMADFIRSILQDDHNNLWVGTDLGVQRIENPSSASPKFIPYYIVAEKSKRFIRSLYLDKQDNLYTLFRNAVFKYRKS